jgi:hypothetical protein
MVADYIRRGASATMRPHLNDPRIEHALKEGDISKVKQTIAASPESIVSLTDIDEYLHRSATILDQGLLQNVLWKADGGTVPDFDPVQHLLPMDSAMTLTDEERSDFHWLIMAEEGPEADSAAQTPGTPGGAAAEDAASSGGGNGSGAGQGSGGKYGQSKGAQVNLSAFGQAKAGHGAPHPDPADPDPTGDTTVPGTTPASDKEKVKQQLEGIGEGMLQNFSVSNKERREFIQEVESEVLKAQLGQMYMKGEAEAEQELKKLLDLVKRGLIAPEFALIGIAKYGMTKAGLIGSIAMTQGTGLMQQQQDIVDELKLVDPSSQEGMKDFQIGSMKSRNVQTELSPIMQNIQKAMQEGDRALTEAKSMLEKYLENKRTLIGALAPR